MAEPEIIIAAPDHPPPTRRDTRFRLTLLLTWVILAAAVIGTGERRSDLTTLETALATGRISQVAVTGDPLATGNSGPVTQTVHWWADGQHRVAQVSVRTPDPDTDSPDGTDSEDDENTTVVGWTLGFGHPDHHRTARITGTDIGDYLQTRHPQLIVTRTSTNADLDGARYLLWQIPTWLLLLGLALHLAILAVIVTGPQPWRATRWAWFWLFLNPIGPPAFLLLSGPTPLIPPPHRTGRRLTGGWAFLLSLILPG